MDDLDLTDEELIALANKVDPEGEIPTHIPMLKEVAKAQLQKVLKHSETEAILIVKGTEHTEEFTKHRDRPELRDKISNILYGLSYFHLTEIRKRTIDQIIALIPSEEEIRQSERERYNEAIVLVVDIAGLQDVVFVDQDILSLSHRAEEIMESLKKGEDSEAKTDGSQQEQLEIPL